MTADPACVPMPHRLSECASCIDRMSEARDENCVELCERPPVSTSAGECDGWSMCCALRAETDRVARGRGGVQLSADHRYAVRVGLPAKADNRDGMGGRTFDEYGRCSRLETKRGPRLSWWA